MVDRQARRELASALKKLASGKITNDEYVALAEKLIPSADESVSRLAYDTAINIDEWDTNRCIEETALNKKERRVFARWILFLHSDCEMKYAHWPRWGQGLSFLLIGLIHLFLWYKTCVFYPVLLFLGRVVYHSARNKLGFDYGPFKNKADFELALRQPILGARGN